MRCGAGLDRARAGPVGHGHEACAVLAMLWFAVALFFAAYLAIIFVPWWKRRGAAAAAGRVAPPIPAAVLKAKLADLGRDHPEIDVEIAGALVRVTWNLEEATRHAQLDDEASAPTYQLELQIQGGATLVNVRYATGT